LELKDEESEVVANKYIDDKTEKYWVYNKIPIYKSDIKSV